MGHQSTLSWYPHPRVARLFRYPILAFVLASCTPSIEEPSTTPSTSDTTPPTVSFTLETDPESSHHLIAAVNSGDAGDAGDATVVCTADLDPSEVHIWRGTVAPSAEVHLSGLLADTLYLCELSLNDQVVAAAEARTPPQLWPQPVWAVTSSSDDPHRGYTLFNTWTVGNPTDQKLWVVDPQGRPRFVLPISEPDNGGVEFTVLPLTGKFLAGGGYGYPPTLLHPWGEVQAQAPDPTSGFKWHHDVIEVADGVVASLSQSIDTTPDGELYQGFEIEERDLWNHEVYWVWTSQSAVDAGTLEPGLGGPDRYHANALSYVPDDPDGPAYWVSLAYKNRIIRISRDTREITWQLGHRGDFDLVDTDGNPLDDAEWFFHGHDPEIRLPKLLVHDNGVGRPGVPDSSRVVEYELDLANKTATRLWSWTEPGWYENVLGDADRLENGHVLVAQGHCYFCPTGDPDRRSSVLEMIPETGEVVWRLQFEALTAGVYRAERVDGCDLFANQRYCPGA